MLRAQNRTFTHKRVLSVTIVQPAGIGFATAVCGSIPDAVHKTRAPVQTNVPGDGCPRGVAFVRCELGAQDSHVRIAAPAAANLSEPRALLSQGDL